MRYSTEVTAKWYIEKCLPEVFSRVSDKGIMLHDNNNASSYMVGLPLQILPEQNIKLIMTLAEFICFRSV